jgi:hypothetical protein
MSPKNLSRNSYRNRYTRKLSKLQKARSFPLLIASVCVLAAVGFAISVQSRNGGWLRKGEPNLVTPQINAEQAKDSRTDSAGSTSNRSFAKSPAIANLMAPLVTASKTDALFTDVDLDGKADPGDTLKYTVVIGATGEDATGVTFTDTVDPNTAFVGGSLRTTPLARNDSYSASGNIRISVAAPGVLANDADFDGVGPAVSVTAGSFLSAQGGNVNLSADGSFTYNPPAGYEGPDSFTYTLNDNDTPNNTDTATVSLTVSGMIWFINNNAASCLTLAAGCGRLTNPFSTLAAFAALNNGSGNNPAANDNIFVYESAIDYVGPVTLLNGQRFIGQDATASLSAISGVTPPAGSDPLPATNSGNGVIVNITSAANAINVGQNNTLRGFTGGNAGTDINGTGFLTLNISDVTLNGNGRTLNLDNGTLTGTFASLSSASSATTGLTLTSVAGSLTTGSTSVTGSTGIGISVGTSSATLNFANTSVSTSGGTGVSLLTNSGTITFGALTITPGAGQRGLLATDNTQTITVTSGSVSTSNAVAVEITRGTGTTPLVVSLTSVSANGGTNGIVLTNTSGSFTITGDGGSVNNSSGGTIQNTTSHGIALSTVSNVSLDQVNIPNTLGNGINGTSVTGFNFTNSTIAGAGDGANEYGIFLTNIFGTGTITGSSITNSQTNNLKISNNVNTAGTVNISSSTFTTTDATNGGDCVSVETGIGGSLAGNLHVNLTGSNNLNTCQGDGIQASGNDNSTLNVSINGTGSNYNGNLGSAVNIAGEGNAQMFVLVENFTNVSTGTNGVNGLNVINIQTIESAPGGTDAPTLNATVRNNTVTSLNNGTQNASGIRVILEGRGTLNANINNNTVNNLAANGIIAQARAGNGAMNLSVNNNTVSLANAAALDGVSIESGSSAGTDTNTVCLNMFSNNSSTNLQQGYRLRKRATPVFRLQDFPSGTVQNWINVTKSNTGTTDIVVDGGAFTNAPAPCGTTVLPSAAVSAISEGKEGSSAMTAEPGADDNGELFAGGVTDPDEAKVTKLTTAELNWIVQQAIARWEMAGISAENLAKLQTASFEIADLNGLKLATAKSGQITIDETAAGYGWYVDLSPSDDAEFDVPVPGRELQLTENSLAFGKIDLLTVVMRQLGRMLNQKPGAASPRASLMQNSLSTGVRRLPDSRGITLGRGRIARKELSTGEKTLASQFRTDSGSKKAGVSSSTVSNMNARSNPNTKPSRGLMHHAVSTTPRSLNSMFADVLLNIGTLPAGKNITITFNVTVNNPYLGATNQVSNQGTVSGANFSSVLTDDPDVAGTANPTVTTIDQPDVTVAVSPDSVLEDGATNLVYTFTREGSTAAPLTVNFSVGGTATFNTDYTQTGAATFNASSGTVTIPAGSSTATVTLDPTADTTVESNETAILTVTSGASYDVGGPSAATGTITNDDTDVSVAVAPSAVNEDDPPNLVYTFTRAGVTSTPLTVNFTIGGTATFAVDYTQTGAATFVPPNGTVTFTAGSSTATVTVDPTTDNLVEPNETVILTLAAGTGYNVIAPDTATGTINNDDAEVTLAVSPSNVNEDGAPNLVYTFTRTGDTTGPLVVNFTVGGTADPSTDYTQTGATTFTPPNATVTIGAGNATATVTVDPTADALAEPDETVVFTLAAGVDYNIGTPSSATGTINNDDTAVSVAVSPGSVNEDGPTNLVYTFTRSDSSGALTVNFSIGGTATFNTDYTQTGAATFTPPTGTVTFADGSLTTTVTVDPSADSTVEPDETVVLTVTAGAGYAVGAPSSATGTITNDDTDVSVAVSPLSTTEDGAGNLVYTFTRTGVTTGALTANFTINGTATFNTDYTQTGATTFAPPNGTVDFAAGSSTATVTVDPTADNTVEPDETVILTVAAGTGYNVGAPSTATGTITNDDSSVSVAVAPLVVDEDGATNLVYTFTRTGSTTGALTVNFSVGGTADSSTDYTQTGAASFTPPTGTVAFAAGNSTATVTIDPSADASTEPDETVILTVTAGTGYEVGAPASATGTINNDDNGVSVAVSPLTVNEDGATNLVYTFTRGDSSGALTVNFSIGGTATFNTDYTQTGAASFTPPTGTVTFADGSLTATVTVDPSADITVEPNETVVLTVTAGAGYTVGAPSSATGTINNDDTDVSVAVSPLSVTEDGATNLVYTFTRNGVTSSPLTVNFSVGGTATFNTDYTQTGAATFTPPTGTVTFGAGNSTATVTVDPTADGAAEADETVSLTLAAGTGYNVVSPSSATGTITNDDTEVSVAVSPSSALEDGATNMVYTFTRTGIISGPLTVNFSVSGTAIFAPPGGDYTQFGATTFTNGGPGTVDFIAGSSTATVTVDPFGDADLEPDETVILTVTAGAGYTVGSPNSATGTILNDDNSVPTIVVGYGQCGSGQANGTMNLTVNDVETSPGSLTLSATSSNTAVVPLANISFGGSGSNRTVTINGVPQSTLAFSDVTITVSDGTLQSSVNIRVIVGTNASETITLNSVPGGVTTVGSDMIFGRNGDDTINAGAGNDLVCGGNSGGTINGGLGDDTLDGGNGNDTLIGGDGNDHLIGGNGTDTLQGGNNDDTLTGGSGPDSFSGGPGNDTATDFTPSQGDTKDATVEVAALFGIEDKSKVFAAASGVEDKNTVLAYVVSSIPWWVRAILGGGV